MYIKLNINAYKVLVILSFLLITSMVNFVNIAMAKDTYISNKNIQSQIFNDEDFVNISVKASKSAYKIKEHMKFTIVGKGNFYLYVFIVTNNKNIPFYPNITTKSNFFHAGQTYHLPQNVAFYGTKVGEEKLLFIASKKKVKINSNMVRHKIMLSEDLLTEDLQVQSDNTDYKLNAFLSNLDKRKKSSDGSKKNFVNQEMNVQKSVKAVPQLLKIRVYR